MSIKNPKKNVVNNMPPPPLKQDTVHSQVFQQTSHAKLKNQNRRKPKNSTELNREQPGKYFTLLTFYNRIP